MPDSMDAFDDMMDETIYPAVQKYIDEQGPDAPNVFAGLFVFAAQNLLAMGQSEQSLIRSIKLHARKKRRQTH